MNDAHILIVDDDHEIANLVEIYLTNEGYNVYKAHDGREALAFVKNHSIQLMILDIMMPHIDGLEVCRQVRREQNIPIIMLSAKSEDMDKIMGLSTGADDYVTKPFHPMELVARVKSQLRRYLYLNNQGTESINIRQDELKIKGVSMNKTSRDVKVYDQPVSLTPTEFDILYLMLRYPGQVFSAEAIFESVWKEKYYDSHNTVMVHIRKIREKLNKAGAKDLIKTVWGVGYKIEK